MTLQVRQGGAWRSTVAGRFMYIRVNSTWRPILDMWVKGGSVSALPANTFIDPFDTVTAWTGGAGAASVAGGRTGNGYQATSFSVGQGGAYHALPAAQQSDTVTVGFAFKVTSLVGDNQVLSFMGDAGATLHTSVNLGNDRAIYAIRGLGTILGSAPPNSYPAAGTWCYVEVQCKIHDTTGYVIVRINGTVVLNLTAQDTKNAGTGTVIDSIRLSSGHSANGGIVDDFYSVPGTTFIGDMSATSPPVTTDSLWHKVADYSAPEIAAPTGIRMNPADVNNHNSFTIAWDWTLPTNGLPNDDFEVVLTNEGGGWLVDVAVGAGVRGYTFSGLNQNTRYQAYVRSRYNGGGRGPGPSAWSGPLKWQTGADSYVVNDIPVYDWRNEFEWMPPFYYNYTSAANNDGGTWGFNKAIDNNFSSYWNTDIVSEPNGSGYQGEGWMVQPPGGHYLFTGIRAWTINPHTWWLAVFYNGGWQGGSAPYAADGKYTMLRHNYITGVDQSGAGTNPTFRFGNYVTDVNTMFVSALMQYPGYDGFNWRIDLIELRLLFMSWTLIRYDPRTVAAVNSGYW